MLCQRLLYERVRFAKTRSNKVCDLCRPVHSVACDHVCSVGQGIAPRPRSSSIHACHSADRPSLLWQAMGVAVELGPEGVARCVREAGVGFMMAPRYHPAMAAVVPVRRSLKVLCWARIGLL